MATTIKNLGKVGWIEDGTDVYSFQIGSAVSPSDPSLTIAPNYNQPFGPMVLHVDGLSVLNKGPFNNNDETIELMLEQNRLLPELIEKQVRIMYGKGPHVYCKAFEKNKLIRKWEDQHEIQEWLDSFEDNDLPGYMDTAKTLLRRYYYFEEFYTKMVMRGTRLLTPEGRKAYKMAVPIAGFEIVENKRCRLASTQQLDVFYDDIEERDFQHVMVGNWLTGMKRRYKKYPKLNPANILKHAVGITHHKNDAVGKIYGINKFFEGVKDWITGSNLTPKNINSFIRNSLAAKIHIIVPNEWCDMKRDMLRTYCDLNANRVTENDSAELIKIKLVDGSYLEIGNQFHEGLFQKLFKNEVEKCVRFLTGPENQGKVFSTISFKDDKGNDTGWKFEAVDLKYKEYIDALISYDKRADDVLIASKGLPANISNIDKDGVISKSGSDLYYNYIIYLHTLTMAEEICMQPFNMALKINFPELYKQGYRIGLYNDIPQKQEDTTPADRLPNNINPGTNAA